MSDLRRIGDDVRRLGRVPAVDPMVVSARRCWRQAVGDRSYRKVCPGLPE